jgi:thiamine pyrophosphate-dependent acetolactate synthase large subunit-like protein
MSDVYRSNLRQTQPYNMKGMGDVLNMYGSSLHKLETEHEELIKKYHKINYVDPDSSRVLKYKNKIKDVRRQIKRTLESIKESASSAVVAITKKKPVKKENKKTEKTENKEEDFKHLLAQESEKTEESENTDESEKTEQSKKPTSIELKRVGSGKDRVILRKRLPSVSTTVSSNSTTELSSM